MAKVGIITFHKSDNCGSMLQAFALQSKVCGIVPDCEIIDFSNEGSRRMYGILPYVNMRKGVRFTLHCILLWIRTIPYYNLIKKQKQCYNEFSDLYLRKSKEVFTSDVQLRESILPYTHYISGSDQVWNISCNDADDAYFLDFVNHGKKIAYAVSLGGTPLFYRAKDVVKYQNLISNFDFISVRENNAVNHIKESVPMDVCLELDPTLLLSQNEWEKRIDIGERLIKEDYIFYYGFHYSSNVNAIVKDVSTRYHLPVYIVDARAWGPKGCRFNGLRLSPNFGPSAFLNLMKYAKLCLTTSFHGTVFSIIFQKPFWFIESDMHSHYDDRVSTLTSLLGIQNRRINGDSLRDTDAFLPVDYNVVNTNLRPLVTESLKFINKVLA